jgi:NitT/TauT family transport system ATP-binding protein/sulfonate transport system ATP-binding protein
MGPRLNIDIAEKRFPGFDQPLLADFHLVVEPSSILALVGPSGVGKSTLLRMLAGIDNDYTGRITIGDTEASRAPPAGFMFQDARLLPWLTTRENITSVWPSTTAAKADDLLARVGLGDYIDALPHELSGGMQRRVALARAVSVNPRFWLFDEPFVSLDRQLVGELQTLFLDLAAMESPTVVLVTHVPEDAARLATRAIALQQRPVRIAADIDLGTSPSGRTASEIAEIIDLLGAQQAGTAA